VTWDVLVVGAGPAGCAAAARSSLGGATVAMVHRPRRNQRPSEALAGAAARLVSAAGLGTVDDVAEGRCGGTLSAWGTDHLAAADSFPSPEGAGWWIDRVRFDAALRDRCAALGVAVVTGRVTGVRREQPCWVVSFAGGAQTVADWVIDATGRAGVVARQLGASRRLGPELVAVHARTSGVSESVPSRVFLEAEPNGWWYVGASSQNRIGAAAVVQPSDARWLLTGEHFAQRLGQTRHLSRWAHQHSGWSAPRTSAASGSALDRVFGDGWVACGDAAMALDPISGQGLLGALAGGLAAAQAICSSDTRAQMRRIATRHADVLRIYNLRRAAAYLAEQRWPQQPFWSAQRSCRSLG
jgi:flavin-dependent dehydrogenase